MAELTDRFKISSDLFVYPMRTDQTDRGKNY